MHVCMMHTSIILDPETWLYDAVLFGNERTDKAILGVGWQEEKIKAQQCQPFCAARQYVRPLCAHV